MYKVKWREADYTIGVLWNRTLNEIMKHPANLTSSEEVSNEFWEKTKTEELNDNLFLPDSCVKHKLGIFKLLVTTAWVLGTECGLMRIRGNKVLLFCQKKHYILPGRQFQKCKAVATQEKYFTQRINLLFPQTESENSHPYSKYFIK